MEEALDLSFDRLRMMMRQMLQMKRERLYDYSINNYVHSPNIIRMIKSNKFLKSRNTSPRGIIYKRVPNLDQRV